MAACDKRRARSHCRLLVDINNGPSPNAADKLFKLTLTRRVLSTCSDLINVTHCLVSYAPLWLQTRMTTLSTPTHVLNTSRENARMSVNDVSDWVLNMGTSRTSGG